MTPFWALYSYDPELPSVLGTKPPPNEIQSITERINGVLNARKTLEQNWLEAQAQQARYYNKRHKPKKFDLNLWVFLSSKNIKFRSGKLALKWLGLFKIL